MPPAADRRIRVGLDFAARHHYDDSLKCHEKPRANPTGKCRSIGKSRHGGSAMLNVKKSVFSIWYVSLSLIFWGGGRTLGQPCGGMQDLGSLGGVDAETTGVSADGSVVVGFASNANWESRAFRWTVANGIQNLGTFGGANSWARGVSADGSVVVGTALNAAGRYRAFRWTIQGGMQDLGTLGGTSSDAASVSADGSVVVGQSQNRAFRWTSANGMQDLGAPSGQVSRAAATAVSADGSVVVGWYSAAAPTRAFRWTSAGGMQDIGVPSGYGVVENEGPLVSANGSAVVGLAYSGQQLRAFRWTPAGGMHELGTLGGTWSRPSGLSADGSIVVGQASNASGQGRVFRWTAGNGMQDLGFAALTAGVSADGSVIVGTITPGGRIRAFRWTAAHGVLELGTLGGSNSWAGGVSADGWVVVGKSYYTITPGNLRPFRWVGNDTDEDGLLDDWECNGIPYIDVIDIERRYLLDADGDGISDANSQRKDLFVEVDRLQNAPFSQQALSDTIAAFAAAPVDNPDQSRGISLHIVVDEGSIVGPTTFHENGLPNYRRDWFGSAHERTTGGSENAAARLAAKGKAYRYCLFANRMTFTQSNGQAGYLLGVATGIPGTTFAVSLGGLNWPQAEIERCLGSTFMHELGHTLGLCHGGGDHRHYKPNYISAMNYNFDLLWNWNGLQWVRLPLDFSREVLDTLDETCLDESLGVRGSVYSQGVSVPFATTSLPSGRAEARFRIGDDPVNWNNDGSITSCAQEDVTWYGLGHPLEGDPTPGKSLPGHDDWHNIRYAVPQLSPVLTECSGAARVCAFSEELAYWHQANIPPPTVCPPDINGDGNISMDDFALLQSNFGATGNATSCDIDADGTVDFNDLTLLLARFGTTCP